MARLWTGLVTVLGEGGGWKAATAALLSLVFAALTGLLSVLDRDITDLHTVWRASVERPIFPQDILVVGIDDTSVSKLGRLGNWSRERYAALLDRMGQARAVGLDILFTEPETRGDGDKKLAAAVQRQGRVVVPLFVYSEPRPITNESQAATRALVERMPLAPSLLFPSGSTPALNANCLEPPLNALIPASAAVAYASVNADADNIYRRPILVRRIIGGGGGERLIPHFTTAIASVATRTPLERAYNGGALNFPGVPEGHVPLTQDAVLLRSFARRGGSYRSSVGAPVPYMSFVDALSASPDTFANKIVLVGETLTGGTDIRANPIDNGLRGVELNAEILANLLYVRPLAPFPALLSLLLALTGVGVPAVLFRVLTPVRAALYSLGALAAMMTIMEAAFWWGGLVPAWSFALLSVASSTLFAGLQRAGEESAKRRQLQESFSLYVAPEMVAEIMRNPKAAHHGMTRLRCGVLFADIRSFTTYSETAPPEVVERQVNEYLTAMAEAVFARCHFLDKFVGDEVMALFGPFKEREENWAAEAVICALDMLNRLDRLNAEWAGEGLPQFRIGIGIHVGEVLFGNIGSLGSPRRLQRTAIGDSVNLASRLQSETKEQGVTILVSEDVQREALEDPALAARVVFEDRGEIRVRGRQTATHVYSATRVASGRRAGSVSPATPFPDEAAQASI